MQVTATLFILYPVASSPYHYTYLPPSLQYPCTCKYCIGTDLKYYQCIVCVLTYFIVYFIFPILISRVFFSSNTLLNIALLGFEFARKAFHCTLKLETRYMSLHPNNMSRCPQSGLAGCLAPAYHIFWLVDTSHYSDIILSWRLLTSTTCIPWRETQYYYEYAIQRVFSKLLGCDVSYLYQYTSNNLSFMKLLKLVAWWVKQWNNYTCWCILDRQTIFGAIFGAIYYGNPLSLQFCVCWSNQRAECMFY